MENPEQTPSGEDYHIEIRITGVDVGNPLMRYHWWKFLGGELTIQDYERVVNAMEWALLDVRSKLSHARRKSMEGIKLVREEIDQLTREQPPEDGKENS